MAPARRGRAAKKEMRRRAERKSKRAARAEASEPRKRTRDDALAARGGGWSGRGGAQTRAAISWTDMRAVTSTKEVAATMAEAKESPGGERSRDG